jgi:hypothetical protein
MSPSSLIGHAHSGPIAWDAVALFLALLTATLSTAFALAHALELPNKIGMARDDYFVMQQAYRGWAYLAYLLALQLAALVWTIVIHRGAPRVLIPACIALACLIGAQILFWMFTFPANQATDNWLVKPDNWQALRRNWEYSHAAGAGLQLIGLCALFVGALRR